MNVWMELHGDAGITNYIRMMGSGHVTDYLFKWHNLYIHSQQLCEHYNNLVKTFFWQELTGEVATQTKVAQKQN